MIKPYEKEGSKKEQVGKMFDNIAPRYDLLNRVLSLGIDTIWRKKMINRLQDVTLHNVLDVATGTGDVAIEIHRQYPEAAITGVDISSEMLEFGRKKIDKRGLQSHITLALGDSEELLFPDETFDAVTVAFGVRNYENLTKGLEEMRRVLRPGGKLVVLEFSHPQVFPFKQLYNAYFRYILPQIGKVTSKDPKAYQYLYESVQSFPDGKDFVRLMEKVGFRANEMQPLTLGICTIYEGVR